VVVQTSEPDSVPPEDRTALGILLVLEKGAFNDWLRTLAGLPAPSRSGNPPPARLPLRLVEPIAARSVEVRVRHGARPRVVHVTLVAAEVPAHDVWSFRVSFDPRRLLFVLAEDGAEATPRGTANRDGVVRVRNVGEDGVAQLSARLQFFELQPFESTSFEVSVTPLPR
ncbi:MAG TPA: hypothetical protein VGR00_15400, partial [Thermoanaerobaculia bacterium]|nr:hypothetical protein [Thermoanaerobaculia bacterium]